MPAEIKFSKKVGAPSVAMAEKPQPIFEYKIRSHVGEKSRKTGDHEPMIPSEGRFARTVAIVFATAKI